MTALAGGLWLVVPAQAVILFTHDFELGAQGWGDRDANEMSVSHASDFGNPAGSMRGDFAGDVFDVETDAWRLTSIPNGNDLTQGGFYDLTSFSFQFYADNIAPSDLSLRFGNNDYTFFRGFTVSSIDNWHTFSAPLTFAGWFGGTQGAFDSVLMNTTFIELQVTRNGFDAQTNYFDNFTLNGELAGQGGDDNGNGGGGNGGGGGPSAVPEPNTINLMLLLIIAGLGLQRTRHAAARRRQS